MEGVFLSVKDQIRYRLSEYLRADKELKIFKETGFCLEPMTTFD